MKFSYSWLKEYVSIRKNPKELADLLTLRSFEVQGVEKVGKDSVLDIMLPPNRVSDASGHIGMAREIAVLLKTSARVKSSKIKEDKKHEVKDALKVRIDDSRACRRYIARVILNASIADSPLWLQERLIACGLRPINNLVDATNYVMLETGQPLHVFDLDKIEGGTIIIRSAKNGETMEALDGQKISLTPHDCVIADAKNPIALAGVKGGKKAEVDLKTTNIVLESASFNPSSVRKTSRRTGVRTDSSHRFEHDPHPELAAFAMERLAALMKKISSGNVLSRPIDIYPKAEEKVKIELDVEYGNRLVGTELSQKSYEDILKRIGCVYVKKGAKYMVAPPAFRRDLRIAEDLIEEVIRIFGYENIPEAFPVMHMRSVAENARLSWIRFIRGILPRLGFSETYRYAFIGKREIELLGRSPEEYSEIVNPLSSDFQYLVREPFESFPALIANNLRFHDRVRAFSIDKGFWSQEGSGGVQFHEQEYLTLIAAEKRGGALFYELKGSVSELLESMGIDDYWFGTVQSDHPRYSRLPMLKNLHPSRSAEIKIGDETIGVVGELHSSVKNRAKLDALVVVCELLMDRLVKSATSEVEFREIPKYPAIQRDIALLVPEDSRIEEVQGVLENSGGALLEDVDFFDEYSGSGIPDEKRSLAFRLIFRSHARTLEEKEVDESMKKILQAVEESGWEARGSKN